MGEVCLIRSAVLSFHLFHWFLVVFMQLSLVTCSEGGWLVVKEGGE